MTSLSTQTPVKYAELATSTLLKYAELETPTPVINRNSTPLSLSICGIAFFRQFRILTGVGVSSSG